MKWAVILLSLAVGVSAQSFLFDVWTDALLLFLSAPPPLTRAGLGAVMHNAPMWVCNAVAEIKLNTFIGDNTFPWSSANDFINYLWCTMVSICVARLILAFGQFFLDICVCHDLGKVSRTQSWVTTAEGCCGAQDQPGFLFLTWSMFRGVILFIGGIVALIYTWGWHADVSNYGYRDLNPGIQMLSWIGLGLWVVGMLDCLSFFYAKTTEMPTTEMMEAVRKSASTKRQAEWYLLFRKQRFRTNVDQGVHCMTGAIMFFFATATADQSASQTASWNVSVLHAAGATLVILGALGNIFSGGLVNWTMFTCAEKDSWKKSVMGYGWFSDWNLFFIPGYILLLQRQMQPVLIFFWESESCLYSWWYGYFAFAEAVAYLITFVVIVWWIVKFCHAVFGGKAGDMPTWAMMARYKAGTATESGSQVALNSPSRQGSGSGSVSVGMTTTTKT